MVFNFYIYERIIEVYVLCNLPELSQTLKNPQTGVACNVPDFAV